MNFKTFQSLCFFSSLAYAYQDNHMWIESVCNRNDRRPDGHSWSICDEAHCPYFGTQMIGNNIIIYQENIKIGKAKKITAKMILEPEEY